ncbi:hypothetical protein (SIR2 domain) [Campylobacter subantarcticus LMG 24377]|uniref:Deacetylase sirtuin-type domain-containing protein n=1 Tax=Campylobacter subantarcticus TaxID=497724 RepID=A0ABW9N6W9_9BACT|nr:SIR2 family protein [Campylobacter subantarcticus]AJC92484.1 hypothetical protein (SIR2 domain) [Campylobacter subantarcticus LMG 24377]EAL3939512.1 hypothetical protein [Campylobacter lari]MPC00035.1 hypothetical protein [Campylobacter subantarcticus]
MKKEQYEVFLNTSIKNIKKALDENYLSIFAGAGISANSRLPTWSKLIEDISKELYGNEKYSEYNLVLAEKFYNQFGENYYYQKLSEFIPNNKQPNDLHKKIVKLNLKNLITTNWDNLFEKAIDEEGCFYNIIKKDEDIGFATGFSKLIKMHGSLEDQNIVFKEDDYLKYSDNFPLIENYIKGIFSTDLVVLMGYSLSDSNVKQIISWVNSKASNIKPVYLVKINKKFDKLEFDFYKNKNIYILYLDEIYKKNDYEQFLYDFFFKNEINNSIDNVLNLFFNDIDENCLILNKLNNQEINDKVEEFLQKYRNCKFVILKSFVKDFKNYFTLDTKDISFDIDCISINNKKLINFVDEKNYKAIANLTKTLIYINNKYIKPDYKDKKDIENILYFNYDNIEKEIKELSLKDLSDEEELNLAFWLYQNEHYIQSYNTLKRVSKNAFKNKDYTTWFISEINRKNFIFKGVTKENEEQIRTYLKEMNKIDADELYLKLPKKNRLEVKSLKELDSYIDKNLIKINELQEKISRDYNNYKNGGFNINNNIYLISNIFQKILNIEIDLKLMCSLESIYDNVVKSFLIYSANEGLQKEKNKEENISIDIDIYLFSFAIKYVENQDLKNIFDKYFKQSYVLKLDNNEDINKIYKNICKNFITQGFITTKYSKLFDNFLAFSSWINLTQENFNLIIDNFNEKLENNLLGISQYDGMNYFLSNQYQKNKNLDFSNITNIIKKYINAFLSGRFGGYNTLALQRSNMFYSVFNILINKKIKLEDSFNTKISEFITNLKNKNINDKYYYTIYLLRLLSYIVIEVTQQEIDDFNREIYNQVKNENKDLYTLELGFCLYSDKKIPKEEYKKEFFEIKKRTKEEYDKKISKMELNNLGEIMSILDFIEQNEKKIFGEDNE